MLAKYKLYSCLSRVNDSAMFDNLAFNYCMSTDLRKKCMSHSNSLDVRRYVCLSWFCFVSRCMRQLSEYQEMWFKYIQENIKHIHEISDLDLDKAISNTLITDLKIGIFVSSDGSVSVGERGLWNCQSKRSKQYNQYSQND